MISLPVSLIKSKKLPSKLSKMLMKQGSVELSVIMIETTLMKGLKKLITQEMLQAK